MIDTAVILAGGKGTRLQTVANGKPKPLVDVKGQPFLTWQLMYLKSQGIKTAIVLVGHEAEQIIQQYSRHPIEGLKIQFVREVTPMGTGGALKNALAHLPDSFFLVNGDSFLPVELEPISAEFEQGDGDLLIVVLDPCDGVPVPPNIQHSRGKIVLYKKDAPKSEGLRAVDAGLYIFKKDVLTASPQETQYDLSVYLQAAIAQNRALAFITRQIFFDIGTPERLNFFKERLHDYFEDTV